MPRGRTFEDGSRARVLFDQGKSCNAIAKELGVSPSTISGWAKREGLSFDRSATEDAVAAARVSRAERRGAIIDRLYSRTETVLDRLESETYFYTVTIPGKGSERIEDTAPPAADERSLSSAINAYLTLAAKLELADDSNGLAPVESMLGRLAVRFGLVEGADG
ncbi:MAG: helix-turn-helix domain-containing protein [Proteobacteria bacterium]|nr:helix-turn-helix domain-containing protein [Pseudomonadota bacterium]